MSRPDFTAGQLVRLPGSDDPDRRFMVVGEVRWGFSDIGVRQYIYIMDVDANGVPYGEPRETDAAYYVAA